MTLEAAHQQEILIVDDDEDIRTLLRIQLAHAGYTVQTAASGFEAVKWLEADRVHAVLTDYAMPHMNGLQLLQIIRARWPQIPVIVLTGEAAAIHWLVSTQGAFACLSKPYHQDELLDTLLGALRGPCQLDSQQSELTSVHEH